MTTTTHPHNRGPQHRTKVIVEKLKPKKEGKKGKQKRKRLGTSSSIFGGPLATVYAKTLMNPFDIAPVRLGFGTMVCTNLGTVYGRTVFEIDTIGKTSGYAIIPPAVRLTHPGSNEANYYLQAGGTWYPYDGQNATSYTTSTLQSARIVSSGIRMQLKTPAVSKEGITGAGIIPSCNGTQLNAITTTQIFQSQYTVLNDSNTVCSTYRPLDNTSFELGPVLLPASTADGGWPYISWHGWPIGTTIYVEYVCNIEYVSPASSSLATDATRDSDDQPSVSDEVPSETTLWKTMRHKLASSTAPFEFIEAITQFAKSDLGRNVMSWGKGALHSSAATERAGPFDAPAGPADLPPASRKYAWSNPAQDETVPFAPEQINGLNYLFQSINGAHPRPGYQSASAQAERLQSIRTELQGIYPDLNPQEASFLAQMFGQDTQIASDLSRHGHPSVPAASFPPSHEDLRSGMSTPLVVSRR